MRLVVALSLVALITGCTEAKTPEPGPPDAGVASPASLSSTTPSSDAGGGEENHHHEKNLPPVGKDVKVTFDGKDASVMVADLSPTGAPIALTALVKKALPNQDPAALKYDLVGSDGFHVGTRPACNRPLTGAEIATGKMDALTHNISYDADTKLPGCYRVRAVVRIDVTK